jgi:cytidine deaminase
VPADPPVAHVALPDPSPGETASLVAAVATETGRSVRRSFAAGPVSIVLENAGGGEARVLLEGPGADVEAWRARLGLGEDEEPEGDGDPHAGHDDGHGHDHDHGHDHGPPAGPPPDEELLRAAAEVAVRAYAPYSRFRVGAALRTADGRIVTGANVENGAYPQGQCAEASAIGALVAAGEERIAAAAVVSPDREICPPCGGCRQRLAEFGDADTPVHLGRPGGPTRTLALGDLLPLAFALGDAS